MRTALTMTGCISWGGGCIPCTLPPFCHAQPPLPRMPPFHHACLPFAMHPPFATHAPFHHICPPGMHPPRSNHACPQGATMHAPLGATRYAPQEQPGMAPQSNHACPPGATTHPPEQPRMPLCGQTDTCKNITFANFVCGR